MGYPCRSLTGYSAGTRMVSEDLRPVLILSVQIMRIKRLLLLLAKILEAAIIRQTICKNKNEIDSGSLSVNFVQVSIDGKSLEKVTKIPLHSSKEISDDNRILDQPVTNVVFELLIRIEIVWSTGNTADRLCLSGLEVRKIGLLQ
ncbi:unnamed protein product, partial [Oikopleura dioica]